MLPGYHTFYWMGLVADQWPKFYWKDLTPVEGGDILDVGHWGYFMPQNIREPNNIYGQEDCVGANLTQAWDGAWGWSDTQCSGKWPALCRIVPNRQWYYKSPTTNLTYIFNNSFVNQQDGELGCQDSGGHLVSFHAIEEQQEVRAARLVLHTWHFICNAMHILSVLMQQQGTGCSKPNPACTTSGCMLILLLHASQVEDYYIGKGILMPGFHKSYWVGLRASAWPDFAWIDRTANTVIDYAHWGLLPDGSQEPNNSPAPQLCGLSNYSQAYGGAWGWSDANCADSFPFICRMLRPGNISITSAITNNSFVFFTEMLNHSMAQHMCNSMGMHLTSFENQDEQAEIESGLIFSVSAECTWC